MFSPKRSPKSDAARSNLKQRSKSPGGRAAMVDTPRSSVGMRNEARGFYHSSSTEFNLNSTSSGSSYNSGNHYKLSPRLSTIGAGRNSGSLSNLRESLPENPVIYSFFQIRSATGNFMSKPLHHTSSSTSWRCSIDGKDAIVTQRRLRRPIDTDELREKITRICRSHHAGLVRLHGASISGSSVYLVHERVDGASLSDCLRNPRNPNFTVLSNWLSRVQIATDVAGAIDYLHNFSGMKIGFVHNHIKSSSIIVKEPTVNGKLCHLGTAQFCGEAVEEETNKEKEIKKFGDQSSRELKRSLSGGVKFEGTRGYMSPEFQATGIATRKSDVYAFGVVLLEILSGQEPMKIELDEQTGVFHKMSLIEAAREVAGAFSLDGGGKLRKWVDCRLKDSFPVEVVERMTRLAVECVHEDPINRPDMGRVAGIISCFYLDSKKWAETIGVPTDFSLTLGPSFL
ncbi:hypothetical protein V2J09_008348 [Rumex salicifolius]